MTLVSNMTYHFVAFANNEENRPVILKIGCGAYVVSDESKALQFFNAHGAVKLYDYYQKYNALLLQQAVPRIPLKTIYPEQKDSVIDDYVKTIRQLHNKKSAPLNTSHVSDWLEKAQLNKLPENLFLKAIKLKE